MKKIFRLTVILLLCSVLSLAACAPSTQGEGKYSYISLKDIGVTVGSAGGVSKRDGYEVSYSKLTVNISENTGLASEINQALGDWLSDALKLCDGLRLKMNDEYETERYYRVGCYASFNANGLFSAVCRLDHSEYGDSYSYILNSATWILENGEMLEAEQLLSIGSVDYRNWLSVNFASAISANPEIYPSELTSSTENYHKYVYYALNDGGAVFYLKYDGMYYPSEYTEVPLSFSENPSLFNYDLEIRSE